MLINDIHICGYKVVFGKSKLAVDVYLDNCCQTGNLDLLFTYI